MAGSIPSMRQAILMFHGIGAVPDYVDKEEMPYWVGWDMFQEIVDWTTQSDLSKQVIFTFDDGNQSDIIAARRLADAGLAGKFFVLAGRLEEPGYLGMADLDELVAMGMEVGLHGCNHGDWRLADADSLKAELVDARKQLADATGVPVRSVAIPFGSYNRRVMRRLLREDFDRIYTSDTGLAQQGSRIAPRTSVKREHDLTDVLAIIADRVPFMKRTRRAVAPWIKRNLL
jgi:peptidoglycan/xylan/chitin deacetylase (PgdA/CDA1 family)